MSFLDNLSPIGLGIGLVGGIANIFGASGANKKLDALLKQDPTYTANPIAAQRLSLAQTLLNSRAPGASYAERNIYGNQANQQANIQRNATDASQALALGAANQATTNQAFGQLANQEDQDYQRRYSNLTGAQQGEIQEGDKVYQDQVRRFGDLAQIRGQQNANTQAAWQGISNLGYGIANFGLAGGFSKLFGNGNNGGGTPSYSPSPQYNTYNPGLANTAGSYASPASNYPSLTY